MAKSRSVFICQNCGAVSSRWQGKCEACNEWNTIAEEIDSPISGQRILGGRSFELESLAGSSSSVDRVISGVEEFDRVTGGGFVPGSVILLGRAWNRQINAAHSNLRRARNARRAGDLYFW